MHSFTKLVIMTVLFVIIKVHLKHIRKYFDRSVNFFVCHCTSRSSMDYRLPDLHHRTRPQPVERVSDARNENVLDFLLAEYDRIKSAFRGSHSLLEAWFNYCHS